MIADFYLYDKYIIKQIKRYSKDVYLYPLNIFLYFYLIIFITVALGLDIDSIEYFIP